MLGSSQVLIPSLHHVTSVPCEGSNATLSFS